MRLVMDASAAIEVAFDRGKARQLSPFIEDAEIVFSPDLIVAEIVNTMWKYHHLENLPVTECDRIIEVALGLVDVLTPLKELHREAFLLTRSVRRPAYDMFYLALARREDATFLTIDATLKKDAERQGILVI